MVLVFLIGGSRLFRSGLRFALDDAGAKVVGECGSVEEMNGDAPRIEPTPIYLLKLATGSPGVRDDILALRRLAPEARIAAILPQFVVDDLVEVFVAGADGLVLEDIGNIALFESLKLIDLGEKVFPSQLAALLGGDRRTSLLKTANLPLVTSRELEILGCLTLGMCNKVIATELGLSTATVKAHLKSLLRKLHLHNRTQAAIWAVNAGLIAPPRVVTDAENPPGTEPHRKRQYAAHPSPAELRPS